MATDSDQARAFAARLRDLMRARGLVSTRNRSGVDVAALARGISVSYEMARRYVEGDALPRPDVLSSLADWLQVDAATLAWGDSRPSLGVDEISLARAVRAVRDAQAMAGVALSDEQLARVVARLYAEAVRGQSLSASTLAAVLSLMPKEEGGER